MKKIILTCFLVVISSAYINAQESTELDNSSLKWETKLKKAKSLSKSTNKPLLIFFTGSDWCGPCKMLKADFFESDRFTKFANEEFVLYEADFPRNVDLVSSSQKADNLILKNKYKISSYPTIIILDENEKIIGVKKSYNLMRDPSYHFDFIESVIKK